MLRTVVETGRSAACLTYHYHNISFSFARPTKAYEDLIAILRAVEIASLGGDPYLMREAADHLELLAAGRIRRQPLLPVLQAFAPGPAVGPGAAGREPVAGVALDPATSVQNNLEVLSGKYV